MTSKQTTAELTRIEENFSEYCMMLEPERRKEMLHSLVKIIWQSLRLELNDGDLKPLTVLGPAQMEIMSYIRSLAPRHRGKALASIGDIVMLLTNEFVARTHGYDDFLFHGPMRRN
jgi:hypothetical protein